MILGMTTANFTLLHVLISLVGIGSGLVVMYGLVNAKRFDRSTLLFLITTAASSATGFAFPNEHLTPGIILGVFSLIALAIAFAARYVLYLSGGWRAAYVVTAAVALYFNFFVLITQSFEKVPALQALAPTRKEAPFLAVQFVVLALFIVLTVAGVRRFRPVLPNAEVVAAELPQKPQKRAA